MKRKAKELQLAKREARRGGGRPLNTGGFGSHDFHTGGGGMGTSIEMLPPPETRSSYTAPRYASSVTEVFTEVHVCEITEVFTDVCE